MLTKRGKDCQIALTKSAECDRNSFALIQSAIESMIELEELDETLLIAVRNSAMEHKKPGTSPGFISTALLLNNYARCNINFCGELAL